MSSIETPPSALPPSAAPERQEITIVSHSTLFYWWPVWAMGFILSALTWFDGHVMAIVPAHSQIEKNATVDPREGELIKNRDVVVLPENHHFSENFRSGEDLNRLRVTRNKAFGVSFVIVLLLVTFITNVPLRGMWSLVIIMAIVMLAIIFALADWWTSIIRNFQLLDIRINLSGYLTLSVVLFLLWLIVFVFFDRQLYITFTPGQFHVVTEIGGGERVFDTMGMSVEKQRSDLFRHWILGLGSGDLVVKTSGARNEHFDMHNVLFVGRKVRMINELLSKRNVIETQG